MVRFIICLVLTWLGAAHVAAAEIMAPLDYSDDRSDAAALVRSFYNAVNRHEYARAWDYFANPPAKDFSAFAKGYDDTVRVDIVTGRANSEGAAGATFTEVPVAIRATDKNGGTKTFAGCYTVKAVNAQIQEPPFRALLIDRAKLKPVDSGSLSGSQPEWCGDGEAPKETAEEEMQRVIHAFALQHQTSCTNPVEHVDQADGRPAVHELKTRLAGETASDPERLYRLYEFACSSYAYNFSTVYYLADDYGEVKQLSFAEPHLDIKYEDAEQTKLKSMSINGYSATDTLINASFDAATASIGSFNKWRGIGDASSGGTWVFREGDFVLIGYEADPTLDGEITPIPLILDGKIKN
jgi:Protein of unknown function (DUF1176)